MAAVGCLRCHAPHDTDFLIERLYQGQQREARGEPALYPANVGWHAQRLLKVKNIHFFVLPHLEQRHLQPAGEQAPAFGITSRSEPGLENDLESRA